MAIPLVVDDFIDARRRIAGVVHRTPVWTSNYLSAATGTRLALKCENLQKTGSFKVRGALNKLKQLDSPQGVVTVSAGNHAQALAWAARETNTPSVVVMPATASPAKVDASRGYGAEVILHGTVHEIFDVAHAIAAERGLTFVHPFDDPQIVAGQGSTGLEILDQVSDVETIVVGIGGGGLISGIAAAVGLAGSGVRVVGVEPVGAAAMRRSLDAGEAMHLDNTDTVADGLAAPMAGKLNFEIVRTYVDDVVLVTDEEILDAMARILTRTKLLAEPAGAAATAALLAGKIDRVAGSSVVAVISGGNARIPCVGRWAENL